MSIAAEYHYKNKSYFLKDRQSEDERYLIRYQRAGTRLRFNFARNAGIFLYGGYQYATSYLYSDTSFNLLAKGTSLENAWLLEAGLQLRFF